MSSELFSRTVETRFVFNLLDCLLCGVTALIILRQYRSARGERATEPRILAIAAFVLLAASFALGTVLAGAFLYFQSRLREAPFDYLAHGLQAVAWLLLALSTGLPARRLAGPIALAVLAPALFGRGDGPAWDVHPYPAIAFDLVSLAGLAVVLTRLARRSAGRRHVVAPAVGLAAGLLHVGGPWAAGLAGDVLPWNMEQLAWSCSLVAFALAAGDASEDLFDRVFVRLQTAFIVLAGVMILVITQTATIAYVDGLRSRSDEMAEFVRAHVDYFAGRGEPLGPIVEKEDFLKRVALGFGSLSELRAVRVVTPTRVATFSITAAGDILRALTVPPAGADALPLGAGEYFLIQARILGQGAGGRIELYGTREVLNRHTGRQIVLIFLLFTGAVILSTVTIGLVVGSASVTLRRQALEIEAQQRRLLQASRLAAIGEIAAGVAHEINNPATTILSRASFLRSELDRGRAGDPEDLDAIVSQAQRIAGITRGLLLFSGPQVRALKPVPLAPIVAAALRDVGGLLAGRAVSVDTRLPADLPRVLADPDRLARALENLYRNAVDAMPGGGTLTVEAARVGAASPRVQLTVADTGVGIDRDTLPRILDPFFTTKAAGQGTGLGLSIVHRTVEEHGGTLAVESQPGAGTRFTIVLPAEAP